jgi:hypothetical protein
MHDDVWHVLIIDDNAKLAESAVRELEDAFANDSEFDIVTTIEVDFDKGYELVASGRFDVVILDVRRDRVGRQQEDREKGQRIFADIQDARFLPVIFWTALPHEVADNEMPPLVRVFAKEDLPQIPDAIRAAISSGVAKVMRKIEVDIGTVIREYLWKELAPNWDEDTNGDPGELKYVLITRVASYLRALDIPGLVERPGHRYVYPPVSETLQSGELVWRAAGTCDLEMPADVTAGARMEKSVAKPGAAAWDEWYVVLTPACDLKQGKVDFVLLARAGLLVGDSKFTEWANGRSGTKWATLKNLLSDKISRYVYLPAFRDIPDLVVDLENTRAVEVENMSSYVRKASLSSPYSESLLVKNSQFRGRIGTPDLNMDDAKARLSELASG